MSSSIVNQTNSDLTAVIATLQKLNVSLANNQFPLMLAIAKEHNLVILSSAEHESLLTRATKTAADNVKSVATDVEAQVGKMNSELTHRVETERLKCKSEISTLKSKVALLQRELDKRDKVVVDAAIVDTE